MTTQKEFKITVHHHPAHATSETAPEDRLQNIRVKHLNKTATIKCSIQTLSHVLQRTLSKIAQKINSSTDTAHSIM
jgi:hypothetical protein